MKRREISVKDAPQPLGTYAQAVEADAVYCATQLPLDPSTGEIAAPGVREQTQQCLENLDRVCRGARTDLDHALILRVYFIDREDWPTIEKVFAERFHDQRPARVPVHVVSLGRGARVSIEATVGSRDESHRMPMPWHG
jgi:2-iminobutanoate/2-iminopropanoate deaminase